MLADALVRVDPADAVLVAPGLGGVKLAEAYVAILDRHVVVVRKVRSAAPPFRPPSWWATSVAVR